MAGLLILGLDSAEQAVFLFKDKGSGLAVVGQLREFAGFQIGQPQILFVAVGFGVLPGDGENRLVFKRRAGNARKETIAEQIFF